MYELLKQLKDAGFPQIGKSNSYYYADGVYGTHSNQHSVYEPTTDELIEELGDDFHKLDKYGTKELNNVIFDCVGGWDENGGYKSFTSGSTPKEALIKLYIALH